MDDVLEHCLRLGRMTHGYEAINGHYAVTPQADIPEKSSVQENTLRQGKSWPMFPPELTKR